MSNDAVQYPWRGREHLFGQWVEAHVLPKTEEQYRAEIERLTRDNEHLEANLLRVQDHLKVAIKHRNALQARLDRVDDILREQLFDDEGV